MCMCGICVVVVVCTIDGNLCLSMVILHGTVGSIHVVDKLVFGSEFDYCTRELSNFLVSINAIINH